MTRIRRSFSLPAQSTLIVLLAGSISASGAQINTTWVGGAAGDWNNPANWSPAMVPDNDVTNTFLVDLNAGSVVTIPAGVFTVDGLTVAAGDTLQLDEGATLHVGAGGVVNDGLLVVNPGDGLAITILNFVADATVSGLGMLQLDGFSQRAQLTSDPGVVVTNAATHEIRGRGQLQAGLDNFGLVIADNGELVINGEMKRNNGIITNDGPGSSLYFDTVVVDQAPMVLGRSASGDLAGAIILDSIFGFLQSSGICEGIIEALNNGGMNPFSTDPNNPVHLKNMVIDAVMDASGGAPVDFDVLLENVALLSEFSMFFGSVGTKGTNDLQGGSVNLINSTLKPQANGVTPTVTGTGTVDLIGSTIEATAPLTLDDFVDLVFSGGINTVNSDLTHHGRTFVDGATTEVDVNGAIELNQVFVAGGGSTTRFKGPVSGTGDLEVCQLLSRAEFTAILANMKRIRGEAGTSLVAQISTIIAEDMDMDGKYEAVGSDLIVDHFKMRANAELVMDQSTLASRVMIAKEFLNEMTDTARWRAGDFNEFELRGGMGAGSMDFPLHTRFEVGGQDLDMSPLVGEGEGGASRSAGGDPPGFFDNFDLPIMRIAAGAQAYLIDDVDNGQRNGPGGPAEALYVDTLEFADATGTLNLNGLHLYYQNLIGDPGQIIDVPVVLCAADLTGAGAVPDGEVGIDDFLLVLASWGTPAGDVDGDGNTGITDFLMVLANWGPCT